MKLLLSWLNDYVSISDIDPFDLAEKLTMATAEIEDVIKIERKLEHVVIGEVVSFKKILNKGCLSEVIVSNGEKAVRTVTHFNNLKRGDKIVLAMRGAVLNNGIYVQLKEIAGVESIGKICSAADLNLGPFDEEAIRLPSDSLAGTKVSDLINSIEYILEVDNKSLTHRPDLWGHYGFAREIAAILQRPLKNLETINLDKSIGLPSIPIKIKDHESCQVYCAVKLNKLNVEPSSLKIQSRLKALDQKAVNNLVDLSNYVMFEIGQPTHAFEGSKINGIIVRFLDSNKQFQTLDRLERNLVASDLVICDEANNTIALAGIMGGADSQISTTTNSILLESANFKGSLVRKTARRLSLHTEASKRFEKQLPSSLSELAIKRLLHLLSSENIGFEISSALSIEGSLEDQSRKIEVPMDFLHRRMGKQLQLSLVKKLLESIGFFVIEKENKIVVTVPPYRSQQDISIPEDILEEIARLYGYEKIQPVLPNTPMKTSYIDPVLNLERRVRSYLTERCGFMEVQTYNWFDDELLQSLEIRVTEGQVLLNPTSPKSSNLRSCLLPNLLGVVQKNIHYRSEGRIFEIGKVFNQDNEETVLTGLVYENLNEIDLEDFFRRKKGVVEECMDAIEQSHAFKVIDSKTTAEGIKTNRLLEIGSNDRKVGVMGIVPQTISSKIAPNTILVFCTLFLEKLVKPGLQKQLFHQISKYPDSWFDFSLIYTDQTPYERIASQLERFSDPLLQGYSFLYKYQGREIPGDKVCYTFRFKVAANDHTLSKEEIEQVHFRLQDHFRAEGIQMR